MWPFNRKKHKLFTISLTPQNITCTVLKRKKNSSKQACRLLAYERTPLKQLEFAQAIPFNLTVLKKIIGDFVKKNQLETTESVLSISGPRVFEKIVTLAKSHPKKEEFNLPELETLHWDFLYLCPSAKNGFDFFVCGMKPYHLFSYQLLAHHCGIQLSTLTTGKLAHLHLYKHLQADGFRQAKLSLDLLAQRYDLEALLTEKDIINAIDLPSETSVDLQKEYPFLKSSLGLFLSERS